MDSWQDAEPLFTSDDEKGLVGSMLFDPACVGGVLKTVAATDFGDFALRAVFASISNRHREAGDDGAALAAMVLSDIKDHPAVDDGRQLLVMIHDSVVTAAHAPTYAEAVRDASVRRRIADIASTAVKAVGSQQDATTIVNDMHAECEGLLRSDSSTGGIKKYELADLIKDFPKLNPPVVDGLFREGETANLIAASKVGKSWAVYGLALSIILGHRWLGRFETQQGRVLLIDNELHRSVLASRLQTVAEAMGVEIDTVWRDLDIWPLRGNLRSLQELGAEFERIEPGEYKAIILDAKYRFAAPGVSENDNAAETLTYNLIDQYAAKTEAAFVLVHHSSKGDQSGKAVTDVGSGAGAQSRATDCHMVLRPHEEDGCAVLGAAVRSFPPLDPVSLRWAFPVWINDQHLDPAKLAGRDGKTAQKRAEEDAIHKAKILRALKEAEEPLTRKKLRKAVGVGDSKINRLLDVLESEGVVASEEATIRGNVTEVYTLSEGTWPDVARRDSGHRATGQKGGVAGPLRGAGPRTPVLPGAGPGPETVRATSGEPGGPIPFPEFAGHSGDTL